MIELIKDRIVELEKKLEEAQFRRNEMLELGGEKITSYRRALDLIKDLEEAIKFNQELLKKVA